MDEEVYTLLLINYHFSLSHFIYQVRQGLKTFSNWPTYPQLYVNGELIGGLDIVQVIGNKFNNIIIYVLL